MGIISTIFSSLAALNIGITLAVAAALSTRIVTAGTIDHFGFFEREKVRFSRDRILGFALMFIGIFIMTLKI
jgi:transporter family-2 protein